MSMLSVSATDSGCLPSISAALAVAGPGDTVAVRPGTYREGLLLSQDVTLLAEDGPGTVVIEIPSGTAVLAAMGTLTLRGLELRGGDAELPLIQIAGGDLRLEQCDVRATGVAAVHLRSGDLRMSGGTIRNRAGAGLIVEAGSAEVTGCTIEDIGVAAIVVTGEAEPVFTGCVIRDVEGTGLLAGGSAAAVLTDCRFSGIQGIGVVSQQDSRLRMTGTAVEGGSLGLYVVERAAPTLDSCSFLRTAGHAVMLLDQAAPTLTDCVIENPAGHGVHIGGSGAAHFDGCRIERSGQAGIVVEETAEPVFTGCELIGCGDVGVLLAGSSAARLDTVGVRGSTVGVSVEEQARPRLRGLRLRELEYGVHAVGGAGLVEDSEFDGCAQAGAVLAGDTQLMLRGNRLQGGRIGIRVAEQAVVVLASCEVTGTAEAGVLIEDGASAELTRCQVRDCGGPGVRWAAGSTGRLADGRISGNLGDGVLVETTRPLELKATVLRGNSGVALRRAVSSAALTLTELDTDDHSEDVANPGDPAAGRPSAGDEPGTGAVREPGTGAGGAPGTSAVPSPSPSRPEPVPAPEPDQSSPPLPAAAVPPGPQDQPDPPARIQETSGPESVAAWSVSRAGKSNQASAAESAPAVGEMLSALSPPEPAVLEPAGSAGSTSGTAIPPGPELVPAAELGSAGEPGTTAEVTVVPRLVADPTSVPESGSEPEPESESTAEPAVSEQPAPDQPAPEPATAGAFAQLQTLAGLARVKQELGAVLGRHRVARFREATEAPVLTVARHLVFAGPSGSGRTTVARVYGRALAELGVLRVGHLVAVSVADLIQDPEKARSATGGVLLIDVPPLVDPEKAQRTTEDGEAAPTPEQAGPALAAVLAAHGADLALVLAGDPDAVQALLAVDPRAGEQFGEPIAFAPYPADELVAIIQQRCRHHRYVLEQGTQEILRRRFQLGSWTGRPAGSHGAQEVFEEMLARQANRLAGTPEADGAELGRLLPEDLLAGPAAAERGRRALVDGLRQRLDALVGIPKVKQALTELLARIVVAQGRANAGLPVPPMSRNLLLSGPSGSGRTTIAGLYAQLLTEMGLLRSGVPIELDAQELAREDPAGLTRALLTAFTAARGGLLLIERAGALADLPAAGPDQPVPVALLTALLDEHRSDVVVVLTDVPGRIGALLARNRRLNARFNPPVEFPTYSADDLSAIFQQQATAAGYQFDEGAHDLLRAHFQQALRLRGFGNGRYTRRVLDRALARQTARLRPVAVPTLTELRALTVGDVVGAFVAALETAGPVTTNGSLVAAGRRAGAIRRLAATVQIRR